MQKTIVRGLAARLLGAASVVLGMLAPVAAIAGTEPAGSMATGRHAHMSVALQDGRALIAGGFAASGTNALASAEIFDPASGTFSPAAPMATPRADAGAVLLPNGRVLVVGGVSTTTGSLLSTAEFYDPATGVWTSAGSFNPVRAPNVLPLPDGRVLFLAGGYFAGGCSLYDPVALSWHSCGGMNASRIKPAAAVLADGRVLAVGGQPSANMVAAATAEVFNPVTGGWSYTGSMAMGRASATATTLADGRVLIAGGAQTSTGSSPVAAAELYDPVTGTFTTTGSLVVPRSGHVAVTIGGYVYVVGGAGLNPTAGIERYDPVSGTWSLVTFLSVARQAHAAVTLGNGDVLVSGGLTTSSTSSATATAELLRPGCIAMPAAISPAGASYASNGGGGAISVAPAVGCSWRVTNLPAWISLTSAAQGSGNTNVTYSVAAQTAATARSAILNVADNSFTVTQSGNPCASATVSPSSLSAAIGGTSGTIGVSGSSTCTWTVTGVPSWMTLTPLSGSGGAFISYSVASNPGAPRSATLAIAGRTVAVSQAGNPCLPAPTISPASRNYAVGGGTATVGVTAPSGCTWSVTGKPAWITMSTAGTGNATLNVTAAANSGYQRTATFTVAGNSFTVTQDASPCAAATLDQSSVSVGNGSGSGTVVLTAPASCTWSVAGATGWLGATPTSGSGSAAIGYTHAANASSGAARSATLTIAGRTFTVNQAAGPCYPQATLSFTSGYFSAAGTYSSTISNDGSVDVTAPSTCAWTVGALPAWITATSPLSATGSATFGFVVGNNAGAARSASFAIAGVSYTAHQLAPKAATLPTGRLSTGRASHAVQTLVDGRVLVTGGELPGFVINATSDLYDPATGTFSATGAMSEPRSRHGMARLADGRVLAVGGLANGAGLRLATAEIYDPATGTWTATGAMSTAREGPIVVALADGRVLVTGGTADGIGLHASTEIFDPATGAFTPSGSLTTPRSRAAAALLADGRVLLAGGTPLSGSDLASAEVWEPASGVWTATGAMAAPRTSFTATALANGKVLVAGGWAGGGPATQYVEGVELYDPATGAFSAAGALVSPRNSHSAVVLGDGSVALVGGQERDGWFIGSIERYNPATGVSQLGGQLSDMRRSPVAALLPSGKVLAAGGSGNSAGPLATAELFDPTVCAATPSLSATSATFTATGGSSSVSVTMPAGCPRLAAGTPSWVQVTSGATGAGNGTVYYTVAANQGAARTATFRIASQNFTVAQAAGGAAACGFVGSVASPGTYTGALASGDCTQGARGTSYYTDRWSFEGVPGQQVAFHLGASFDTYLYLRNPAGTVIASNDDGGGGTNSRIPATSGVFTLPAGATGTYVLEVTSYGTYSTGAYTLQRLQ